MKRASRSGAAPATRGSVAVVVAPVGRRGLRRKNVVVEDEEEEEEEEADEDDASGASDDDEEEDVEARPPAKAPPRRKRARAAKTSARRKVKQQQRQEANDEDEDEDEEEDEDNEDEDVDEEAADDDDEDDEAEEADAQLEGGVADAAADADEKEEDEESAGGGSRAKKPRRAVRALASDADEDSDAPAAMDVEDDGDEEEEAAPPTPELSPAREQKAADTGSARASRSSSPAKSVEEPDVPVQNIREELQHTRSDHELLEILTAACSQVLKDGTNPSRLVSVGILSAVRDDPERFGSPSVLKYLLRLLRSKHYVGAKELAGAADAAQKKASGASAAAGTAEMLEIPLPVLIANVLVQVMKDMADWPVDSVKVFLDDSLYSRVWVDHELSQLFVSNVKSILQADGDAAMQESGSLERDDIVRQRFHGAQVFHEMRDLSINHIRSRLGEMDKEKPGAAGGGSVAIRNMILTLIDFASIPQARALAAENMETWLQNPSVKAPTKDLLNKIVSLCSSTDPTDMHTVDVLLKMRLKSTMFQVKVEIISQLVRQNAAYLKLALTVYVARERPNNMSKDIDNMKIIQQIFRAARSPAAAGADELFFKTPVVHQGTTASRQLGLVLRELSSTPDMAPVLKTVVRKILKQLTFEQVDIMALCVGILENEGHWEAITKLGDTRLLDYMALVTGVIWLALLMRGAAVKSMQIQQANTAGRHGAGPSALGNAMKLGGGSQPIPRRGILPIGAQRAPKLGPRDGKATPASASKAKVQAPPGSNTAVSGSVGAAGGGTAGAGGAQVLQQADATKTVKIAVRAREELLQTMASVQLKAVTCCRDILKHFSLSGASSFEKLLYESVVKKLLFLEIPSDVQPTDHDRVCFQFAKEDIPVHEDMLGELAALYASCTSINRLEALRTIETMVFRAAEGHLGREGLWGSHEENLSSYASHGGVVGIEVKSADFIRELLLLTKVDIDMRLEQEFCHSSRYWITCSILLIIGCFNPNTVGEYLWREFPTLRCLMQMAITGRYAFPPVDAQDPLLFGRHKGSFPDLISGNHQLQDYEQQVLQHVQSPALFEDPPMVLEFDGLARQPPPAIIDHLRSLDLKFKLGTRLRQSRAVDFLMEMVTGNDAWSGESGSPESVWWIADIVCEDFDTVQYLPHGCLCKLLLLAYRSDDSRRPVSAGATKSRAAAHPKLSQIIPRLLSKLRDYLNAKDDNRGTASNVVLYYLGCFTSPDVGTRRVASHILQLLTIAPSDDETPLSTPAASDIESVDEDASEADIRKIQEADAMSFAWLPALAKLPCYNGIRERVFWSLESILERESSVQSLTLCIKALHEFWKESADIDVKADAADDGASKLRGAALEQTLVLAGAFGKLLSGREFIAKILLEQREVYAILLEVIWAAIKQQLAVPSSLKSKMGVSFSDCKVFYVADGSSGVREIKLPLHVIHGAIHVLCSPHARDADGVVSGVSAFSKLKLSMFPQATGSAAMTSSTGLIATKDPRLYPDRLLLKLAACSPNAHMCASAVRAMNSETLWRLMLRTGLREQCLAQALSALSELTKSHEGRATSGLTAAADAPDTSEAAGVLLRQLIAYAGADSCLVLSATTAASLQQVCDWLASKASSGRMDVDESGDELLLCRAFATTRVSRVSRDPIAPVQSFFASVAGAAPGEATSSSKLLSEDGDKRRSGDSVRRVFSEHYMLDERDVAGVFPEQTSGEVRENDIASALVHAIESSCASSAHAPAAGNTWAIRIALLRTLRAACTSSEHAADVGSALVGVVGHISRCSSSEHRRDCCEFLRQALSNTGGALSYAAAVAFVRSVAHVEASADFCNLADPAGSGDVQRALQLIAEFLAATFRRWKAKAFELQLAALTVRSVVTLAKDLRVLDLARAASTDDSRSLLHSSGVDSIDAATDLLCSLVRDQAHESLLVSVVDAVLTSDPHFTQLSGAVAFHASVRRDMIGILYFQNPLAVAPHLDTLLPGWESLVSFGTAAGVQSFPRLADRKLVGFVDDMLRDLGQESADATDRFREVATRYPLLVLSRFPQQLLQLLGTLSLTQIYHNTALFRNILHAMDIVRPHLRSSPSLFGTLCKFLIEVLEVIATHQASEFHQLVTRALDLFLDALLVDFDGASEQLFQPERIVVLESVVSLYASRPEVRGFGELVEKRQSEQKVRAAMAALDAARNKHASTATAGPVSAEQYRELEQFVARGSASASIAEELSGSAGDQLCQMVDQLCASVQQQQTTATPLLRRCAEPLSRLLFGSSVTKATMSKLCHSLLNLMKVDPASIPRVVDQYVQSLRALRPGLKETAVAYVLEYLAFADNQQRRHILQQLFDDPSDIAKSKLVAYLKSSAFKSSLLPFARAAVEQSSTSTTLQ